MLKNIGIDITNLNPNYFGGSDTYSNGLINGLLSQKSKFSYQIYLTEKYFKKRKFIKSKKVKFITFDYNLIEFIILKIYNRILPIISIFSGNYKYTFDYYLRNFINRRLTEKINKNSDILFAPNVLLPSYNIKIKTFLNIQDLQHLHFPEFFSKFENLRRKYTYHNSLKYSNKLICSSNFIKKDIKKKFNLKKKIYVIEEGVDIKKFKKKIKSKKIKFKKFFFFPAQLWKHKNHKLVIKAFDIFNKKFNNEFSLIICGKKFEDSNDIIKQIKQTKKCFYLGVISKNLLINYYKNCIATISPALYESSSLTLLEALASGSKVIASDTEPNLERKRYQILFFKKNDYLSLVKQFEISVKQPNKYINKKINQFDWKNISKKWIDIIK